MSDHSSTKSKRIFWFHLIILFTLFAVPICSFSQQTKFKGPDFFSGFIIKTSGDTIWGLLKVPYLDVRVTNFFFRETYNGINQLMEVFTVNQFGNRNGKIRFASIEIPLLNSSEISFVRLLVEGPYNVYFYKFIGIEHVMILGPSGRISDVTNPPALPSDQVRDIRLSEESFNETLKSVFADDPELSATVGKFKPNHKSISKQLIRYYNEKGISYNSYGINVVGFIPGITAGVTFDRLVFDNGNDIQSSVVPSPYVGINLTFNNSGSAFYTFLENSLSFKSLHYTWLKEFPTTTEYNEVFLRSKVNITRAGFNYSIMPERRINPLIEAGGIVSVSLSSEYDNYKDILHTSDNMVYSYLNHDALHSSNYFGAFVRGGININLFNNKYLQLTGGYDYQFGANKEKQTSLTFSVLFFNKFF